MEAPHEISIVSVVHFAINGHVCNNEIAWKKKKKKTEAVASLELCTKCLLHYTFE
jgi:hypothetical protein